MRIIYSDKHLRHDPSALIVKDNPLEFSELPARAEIIRAAVESAGLGPIVPPTDHGLDPILAVHDAGFVNYLQTAYARLSDCFKEPTPVFADTFATRLSIPRAPKGILAQIGYYAFGIGSPIMEGTWDAAYWSAQCALSAADAISPLPLGEGPGARAAYALCRPPGHHAARDLYGGFCYLNNAAIAAHYLQHSPPHFGEPRERGASHGSGERLKVAILDFDYHHGNGTQSIFYSDPNVLFCSIHADPNDEYPYYWGFADERGEGAGLGFNRNFPLQPGTEDAAYLDTLAEALNVIRDFDPRYLVVSAGFDIFTGDPVGGFNVTTEGIAKIGEAIAGLNLPTVIVQEGGYLQEALGKNAVAFLSAFEEEHH
ncbi:MAG: histone deacetylase family protein [Chloroflexi bacterium]|nr:histone deacetylase family protein [Chloroflexota bacterium]